jgi:hypothetical protein
MVQFLRMLGVDTIHGRSITTLKVWHVRFRFTYSRVGENVASKRVPSCVEHCSRTWWVTKSCPRNILLLPIRDHSLYHNQDSGFVVFHLIFGFIKKNYCKKKSLDSVPASM